MESCTLVVLPDELWHTIWRNLPRSDIISVTHVCALWRQVALVYPPLWCDIRFIWQVNTVICECNACLPPRPILRSTSFDYFCALVARSQAMPICLSIEIISKRISDLPDGLLDTFMRIAPRLESFHFRGAASILSSFLASTPSLPLLRTLTSVRHGDIFSDDSWLDLQRPIAFPLVEKLDVDGPLIWPPTCGTSGVSFPNVRSMAVYPWPSGWDSVVNLLDQFPTIEDLTVDLFPVSRLHPAQGIIRTPRRMPALRLEEPFNLTGDFLAQFHEPHFRDVTLDYDNRISPDWWTVEMFRPVREAVHLTLEHYERDAPRMMLERTLITAVDSSGRRRAIDVALRDLDGVPPIAHYLSLASIQSVELHLSLWEEYFLNDDSTFPALSELTLVVYALLEISQAIEASARHNRTTWFPALRILRIQQGCRKLRLPMQPVAALIESLHLPGCLDELYVPFRDRALFQDHAALVISGADAY